ncbi:MAG: hypothetical protein PT939_04985 [Aerococcus suis]|nr:hypothetical protein [Aerococcus suis]
MLYVTEDEYSEFGFGEAKHDFASLVKVAGYIVDYLTNNFYLHHNIAEDYPTRSHLFKLAVCAQINHFDNLGVTTLSELKTQPQTVRIGRTQITNGQTSNKGNVSDPVIDIISTETRMYLAHTGLLYRGVRS